MVLDRLARGGRPLALLAALALPSAALATGGGAGLGGTTTHKHHRKHSRRHAANVAQTNPLNGRGVWIWYVSLANRGSLSSIISQSKAYGVSTLFIKSGDGTSYWSQFSRGLVSTLHRSGIHVCAWQFVYGTNPVGEANTGAAAVRNGADCLMIDAEGQYEGKYVQAQAYIRQLRSRVGASYPLALAGLPYVDYHPGFPYSVFLGPGAAQYNAPQMYWRDIGVSVDGVYSHTYEFNRLYGRAIFPLGESVADPPATAPSGRDIRRFRQVSRPYGASGVSWWMWQGMSGSAWHAISQPLGGPPGRFTPNTSYGTIASGAQGDVVVWAQEHLVAAGQRITIDGGFGPKTKTAVQRFQSAHGLASDGVVGPQTWQALLRYRPAHVTWVSGNRALTATASGYVQHVPKSAKLKAKRYEIPPDLGAGAPPRPGVALSPRDLGAGAPPRP
jgi:peptidoglycan hydrolase-like protein with peptidoglycan-binding domain